VPEYFEESRKFSKEKFIPNIYGLMQPAVTKSTRKIKTVRTDFNFCISIRQSNGG
jgi:hypothetical protein